MRQESTWVHAAISWLLIRINRTAEADNVREFGVYTKDHQEMISHLHQHEVTTIAMESTGSYWQTLFNARQQAGFDVLLVGGNQTKNVKGRKTDVIDCIWIQNRTADAAALAGFAIWQFAAE